MTQKVNGAAYRGIWVERTVTFIKLTFSKDITALPAADLVVLGTATPAGAGTVADSGFAVVESVLVQALKGLATRATIIGISNLDGGTVVDVMLGFADAWFSDAAGLITPAPLPVLGAQAVVTTAGAAPTDTVGQVVGVLDTAVTYTMQFAAFDGNMPVATAAAGELAFGPGATSGATPTNSPTGTPGYYPVTFAA